MAQAVQIDRAAILVILKEIKDECVSLLIKVDGLNKVKEAA